MPLALQTPFLTRKKAFFNTYSPLVAGVYAVAIYNTLAFILDIVPFMMVPQSKKGDKIIKFVL